MIFGIFLLQFEEVKFESEHHSANIQLSQKVKQIMLNVSIRLQ